MKCPRAKSANHCLTELFSIYQNKHWTIRRWDDHIVVPLSHLIKSEIDWFQLYVLFCTRLHILCGSCKHRILQQPCACTGKKFAICLAVQHSKAKYFIKYFAVVVQYNSFFCQFTCVLFMLNLQILLDIGIQMWSHITSGFHSAAKIE